MTTTRSIHASDVSTAWARALTALVEADHQHAVNVTIRIDDPSSESDEIRAIADELLAALDLQDIDEVANTIFPREWAIDFPEPAELAADYRDHYEFLRSLGNPRGTYFGRIVAFPDSESTEPVDQLTVNVQKLRDGVAAQRTYASIYEFDIYSAHKDRNVRRGFPCLGHLSMHVGPDKRLHATAQYRSHDVVAKGYGNYLGLGALLHYVATACSLPQGELLIVAGGAFASGSLTKLRAGVERLHSSV